MNSSMLRLSLLALAAGSATLLTACPLVLGCGGFDGAGDIAYARPNGDSAIACSNGGFIATLKTVLMEGRISGSSVADGATGAFAFDFTHDSATATSTTIGNDWTAVEMNEVALDHADTLCQDLAMRTWWNAAASEQLPIATAFSKPAENYTSIEDCLAANPANPDAICEDIMLLCPDGTAQLATAEGNDHGTYTIDGGQLGVITAKWGISGTYANATGKVADGSLDTFALTAGTNFKVTWQTKALADVSLSCK